MEAETVALFPEPEHEPEPMDDVWYIGPAPDRLRFALVGEDGEFLVIYGHVPDAAVPPILEHRQVGYSQEDAEAYADGAYVQRRWCGWITVCEVHHPPLLTDPDCDACRVMASDREPDRWWWWGTGRASENKRRPGFFPATIVRLDGC
jgi:hypothetical protein